MQRPTAASLPSGQRISFSGQVRRPVLRKALAGRFSWPALATLTVGAVICFAGSPPAFFNPFLRIGRLRLDPTSELLALAGVGFVMLGLWLVVDNCTLWGVRRREQYFLRRVSDLYKTKIAGWLEQDFVYVREDDCESWLCWAALNHFQANEEVVFLEWGSGAGGMTVLTCEMFASREDYNQARALLQQRVSSPFNHVQLRKLNDHFLPAAAVSLWPKDEETVAECRQTITHWDGLMATVLNVPASVLSGSRPLHAFFAILFVLAVVCAENIPAVPLVILGIWGGILLLAALMSLARVRLFVRGGTQRLLAAKTRFTTAEVHISTTVGYFRAPLCEFQVKRCDEKQIVLAQKGHEEIESRLTPDHFEERQQWLALQQMFDPQA